MCFVVRRLCQTAPLPHNQKVVRLFGHQRYRYALRGSGNIDVILYCITRREIIHIAHIVTDMHDISIRYSISQPICELPDTRGERAAARVFLALGVQLDSVHEYEV